MKTTVLCAFGVVLAGGVVTAGCGGDPSDLFSNNNGPDGGDGVDASSPQDAFVAPDTSDARCPAAGLPCQVVSCANGAHTTISGNVFDPRGHNPIYNVYVYIPNAPLQDVPAPVACTQCQALASGSPLPGGVLTDGTGHFQLTDVPVGANIPLVMQIGKFRRQIKISMVSACVDNPVGAKDSSGNETLTRMPTKQHEGVGGVPNINDNIPNIAIATGGCDALECLVRKIGIDDTEFLATGRVHIYQGNSGASTTYSTDAQGTLWSSSATLAKYDVVLNGCECSDLTRGTAYATMKAYVDGGGRLMGTHYHYDWFAPPTGPADYQSVAKWGTTGPFASAPFFVDTTFPKGVAFDKWVQQVFKTNAPPPAGQIALSYSNNDVATLTTGLATRWIYYADQTGPNYGTSYLSFNAPVKASMQCGRAAFSDLHATAPLGSGTFPTECDSAPLTQQEAAMEFLFFDLLSCVQDDTKAPIIPGGM